MGFDEASRLEVQQMSDIARPASGGAPTPVPFPRTGFLARIYLAIRGTITGTISAPNALGKAAIIRRVRVFPTTGLPLIDISGPGYHYGVRQLLELATDITPQSDARSAVVAGAYNLDMVLPLMLNQRDAIGLFHLQTDENTLSLQIEFETDATIATGITAHACTVTPYIEYFTVPMDAADWPRTDVAIQLLEDAITIPAAGEQRYLWPRGNTYLQLIHLFGHGVSGSDLFTRVALERARNHPSQDTDTKFLDMQRFFSTPFNSPRLAGTVPFDLLGSAGLGTYDKARDTIDSAKYTELATRLTATQAGTLTTVRRQLAVLTVPNAGR